MSKINPPQYFVHEAAGKSITSKPPSVCFIYVPPPFSSWFNAIGFIYVPLPLNGWFNAFLYINVGFYFEKVVFMPVSTILVGEFSRKCR